ncbi:ECF transporter S component [Patescibacteria group bacterium]
MTFSKVLPKTLSFTDTKLYIFSFSFVVLAVFVPLALHQFHVAGPKFLPMHFFILIAGFLLGWQTGLIVGIFSPLMSYSISHLPAISLLPEITLELAMYGLITGLLREKGLNIWVSLFFAMIFGRLARLFFVLGFGLETDPLMYFQMSLPGILLQIVLIPLIILLLQKHVFNNEKAV